MLKTKTKIIIGVASIISVVSASVSYLLSQQLYAEQANTTFQVDVKEVLSVSITSPTGGYDEGDVDELLTGQIDISVTSNNTAGFSTGIRASNSDVLVGSNGGTLANLSSSTLGSNFPAGRWGYSLDTASPESKNYNSLPSDSTKINSISSGQAGTKSGSVYFAAKAGYDNPAGTYTGTVNICVVSGSSSPDPGSDPVGPDPQGGTTPSYHGGVTTYTTRGSGDRPNTETVTTEVSSGNNTESYPRPLGETEKTVSNVKTGSSPLPVILAMTSAVSAAAGLGFFIVAKRREEEDEEEDELE